MRVEVVRSAGEAWKASPDAPPPPPAAVQSEPQLTRCFPLPRADTGGAHPGDGSGGSSGVGPTLATR
eukprot:4727389-Prymnesium_polylepis.1